MSNAYNKELGSALKNSNKVFVKEQYKLDHKKSASKVSLYYAHGQTEKTENNFIATKADSLSAEVLNNKTVKAANLTENVLLAAKQSLQDSSSATSNVSTAAANMQIAANAITKLASDLAALKSVAKNTANESKILHHTNTANDLIQDAAKKAEEVSLVSMQATIEAAQATASTVVTNAEAGLAAVKNLHSSTASNYSNLQELTVTDNENLTTAKKNEKLASASFDVTKRQDLGIQTTRREINKVSNHNLTMVDPQVRNHKISEISPVSVIPVGDSFKINFESFDDEDKIKDYRLIVTKYDDSEAFDINIAKDLDPGTYYQFSPPKHANDRKRMYSHTFYLLDAKETAVPNHHLKTIKEEGINWKVLVNDDGKDFGLFNNVINHLAVDYKGKPIDKGTPYVAYVYVVYKSNHQQSIDSTVGYLSQPSEKLTLQERLYAPKKVNVFNPYFNSRNIPVSFQLPDGHYDEKKLEYRIMAVETQNVEAERINRKIEQAISKLEKTEFNYNAANNILIEYTARYNELRLRFMSLSNQVDEQIANPDPIVDLGNLKTLRDQTEVERDNMNQLKTDQEEVVKLAKKKYQKAQAEEAKISRKKISDFVFDTDLMMTVTAANYFIAKPIKWNWETAGIKWVESWVAHETAKFKLYEVIASAEPEEVKKLKNKLNIQQGKVETAQSHLVELENIFEKAHQLNEDTPKKDPNKDKVKKAEETAAENLVSGKVTLTEETDKLHDIERQIEVAQELQEDVSISKITSFVNDMIESKYEMEKYWHILGLILTNYIDSGLVEFEEKLKELIEDILNWLGVKDDMEKIEDLLKEGKKIQIRIPEEKFEYDMEPLPLVLMYTEIGDDATDNYGEPLFQNQSNFMSEAISKFVNLINTHDQHERKIKFDNLVQRFDPKKRTDKKFGTPRISYKAIVLSALSSAYIQDAKEYKNTHSEYSKGEAIIYKTQ